MDAIINFLKGIGDGIVAVFDFFIGFLADLVYLVQLTAKFLAQIPLYFSWLPSEMLALIGLIFAIVVLYKILGREG